MPTSSRPTTRWPVAQGGSPLDSALAGATIVPGLHTIAGAASNTATVTLNGEGDPNAVFVIQVGGAMAMAAGSRVVLTGGAQASRVFWQVNGAGAIGANAEFAGTLMALDAVAVGNRTLINGRAFARNGALTLDADEVYSAPPVVTITGGGTAFTTDTTPTISGTTDVEAPAVVTVTINGQILIATRSGASWSVTSPILANATYPIVASTSDGAGNPGSATQQLTVDTVLPVVTIDGGSSVMTNDPTPTIAGTSDVAPGTVVRVAVDSRTLTALVQYGGWWNVTATPVGEGTWPVVASAPDLAGNVGSARQTLTIATHPPAGSGEAGQTATPVQSVAPSVAPTPAQAARSTNAVAKAAVARRGSQKVKGSSLSIGTKVTAPTDGPVVATASGTVNIKGVVRAVKLTSATAWVLAGGSVTLELRPKGTRKAATAALLKIKQATKKGTQVTATITVKLVDAAGNTREVTRTVKLTR
ncbi:MAG TPA: ice-binding family protein [Baekduia sp.]|nr:ice-binding family protein [Baekduia sp.]